MLLYVYLSIGQSVVVRHGYNYPEFSYKGEHTVYRSLCKLRLCLSVEVQLVL